MRDFKHSGRRAFLRGLGGSVVMLPLLEYTHGKAWAADAVTKRFITCFEHGGTISNQSSYPERHDGHGNIFDSGNHGLDYWRPADPTSSDLVLGPIHQPLEPWRAKLLLLEGIDNKAATKQDPYGAGGHGIANVTALTAADQETGTDSQGNETHVGLGPSIDQVVAERLAARQPVKFDRIHLMVPGHQYGTPYFRAANQPVEGESSPIAAFDVIFEGVSADGMPTPEQLRVKAMRGSALDGLKDQYTKLRDRVSSSDRAMIEAHLDHLRKLEQELDDFAVCAAPDGIDADGNATGDIIGALHAKIIVAALRCGLTNVANLEIADILTPWSPAGLLMDSAYGIGHSLGHFQRDVGDKGAYPDQLDNFLTETLDNRRWRIGLMALILEGLDDPTFLEGDRTILDNSLVLWTSEFREPANHVSSNAEVLLAGSAGGVLPTGKFIDYNKLKDDPTGLPYETDESTHNLFVTVLQAMGESDTSFGSSHADHQGPLPGLEV